MSIGLKHLTAKRPRHREEREGENQERGADEMGWNGEEGWSGEVFIQLIEDPSNPPEPPNPEKANPPYLYCKEMEQKRTTE